MYDKQKVLLCILYIIWVYGLKEIDIFQVNNYNNQIEEEWAAFISYTIMIFILKKNIK